MFGTIRNAAGEKLDTTFKQPEQDTLELVVIGHGVTANKDRDWAVILADALVDAGYATLRFSFSGNGNSEGRFEDSCPTKEAGDLGAVLTAVDGWHVTYVGHSMGAAVGVLRAAEDERIQRLVSLAGMVDTADFARRKFGEQELGDLMWEKPECPISQTFLDDMRRVETVEPMAEELELPWLLVHGTDDTVVPIEESERMHRRAPGPVSFVKLAGADHVFSGQAAGEMARAVVEWLSADE
jgi:pimeloyl-ACP methyl ester carboxylesterase